MVIKESKVRLSIVKKCRFLDVNRSGYYNWFNKKPNKINEDFEAEILKIYHKHKGTYGRERITQALKNIGIVINHKKVHRIMRKLGIKAIIRKRWSIRKYLKENVVSNVLNREFKADEPFKKLVCDVTEMKRINENRYYLFSVMDLYNKAIITASMSEHNDWRLVDKGLENIPCKPDKILLHSDQGAQFTSKAYHELTEKKNIEISMSRVGNCYDNAAKESFFGHFKEEFYVYYNPKTQEELYQNVSDFIEYYNNDRIQMRFKMSPNQYLRKNKVNAVFL
jgi:transposase InsO family protein